MGPVKIKLLTWWQLDSEYQAHHKPESRIISHGIWEVNGVEIVTEREAERRVYSFRCIMPASDKIAVNETRRMYEGVVLALCHEVKLTHLPKLL